MPSASSTRRAAGGAAFKRINRAMLLGGFATFALLYCVQPLMPLLAGEFALTAAQSSWSLSISTAALALSLLLSGAVSERLGRKPLMVAAIAIAAATTVLCAFATSFGQLLALRAALGIALGGMPAIAMAYLGEEIEAQSLGLSMGLYIGGSAFGGMGGRLLTSVLTDHLSWRVALGVLGAAGMVAAWVFWRSLPPSRNFTPAEPGWDRLAAGLRQHCSDRGLLQLFVIAFILAGSFVGMYNVIGYRLLATPFGWSQSAVGALSLLYLIGMFSSVWAGRLADRLGRRGVLWIMLATMAAGLLLTLAASLWLIVPGIALFTFGFFASHCVASSWVGRRARGPKALASALYLFCYYIGSSVIGWLCGVMWQSGGWPAVVLALAGLLGGALRLALGLRGVPPLPAPPASAHLGCHVAADGRARLH
ncbi:MFS transporter [Massilia glaciei]|uniref:MFS transporter n=1 Tax=Massilia glaciei TaxID=1524097 RepID=A0A2U2HLW8_9BURK|nr:MFS transporter [Massilia glaciei]PWF48497.1 MFS transporter [Massilia glaciei]